MTNVDARLRPASHDWISLSSYQQAVRATDRLPADELRTAALGLFGEVGGLLSVVKKRRREAAAFAGYDDAILEELGDVLWYFTCLVNRSSLELSSIARSAVFASVLGEPVTNEPTTWRNCERTVLNSSNDDLFDAMGMLAERSGSCVRSLSHDSNSISSAERRSQLVDILASIVDTATTAGISLDLAARRNLEKIRSRYPERFAYPPLADSSLPSHERLPRRFELFIGEHEVNGKTYVIQTCNGVIIGDRLTDSKPLADDYRFHDVFHVAYAVHLGWSPILRGLFRVKRKSRPVLDENEDGARAGLIEEGIATFIFGQAVERNFFADLENLDFDLLKLVQGFVRGFEVERCALWQWERAILDGYKIFRELKTHRRGCVVADLEAHTLEFRPALLELQGAETVGSPVLVTHITGSS